MGGGEADERVAPRLEPILDHRRHELASLPIPDELLGEILLRLPTPADLVRASTACVSFRRVAARRSFLRRYRKLHAPPLLGFFNSRKVFFPAIAPHPSASAASAVALAADFSFSFLPAPSSDWIPFHRVAADRSFLRRYRKLHPPPLLGFFDSGKVFYPTIAPHPSASAASAVVLAADFSFSFSFLPAPARGWVIRDIRDGRVLLDRAPQHDIDNRYSVISRELVVCDPLHRRYLLLPPIPAALVEDPIFTNKHLRFQIFLVPPSCGVEAVTADETSFRLIWMVQCRTRVAAIAFSSNTGQWAAVPSRGRTNLDPGLPPLEATTLFKSRHYVYGFFYWLAGECEESKLIVLDTKTMEFSNAKPPPEANSCWDFAMVESGEGRPGMFVLADTGSDLSYFISQNDGESQWHKVKTISLRSWTHLICNMDKYLLLHQEQSSLLEPGCFALDIETFQLEKVCALDYAYLKLHTYSNFPPSLLSSPTISDGVEKWPEKKMLKQGCAASSSAESPRSE